MNTYTDACHWCWRHRLSLHIGAYYRPSKRYPTVIYYSDCATRTVMTYTW